MAHRGRHQILCFILKWLHIPPPRRCNSLLLSRKPETSYYYFTQGHVYESRGAGANAAVCARGSDPSLNYSKQSLIWDKRLKRSLDIFAEGLAYVCIIPEYREGSSFPTKVWCVSLLIPPEHSVTNNPLYKDALKNPLLIRHKSNQSKQKKSWKNYKIIMYKMNNGITIYNCYMSAKTVRFIDSYGDSSELNECGGLTPMLCFRGNNVCH